MERDAKEKAIYDRGYEAGYDEGYIEAFKDAQFYLEAELQRISWDIEDEYGVTPEIAVEILSHYADGEPVTEQELNQAIWAIYRYYWDGREIIINVEDNWWQYK